MAKKLLLVLCVGLLAASAASQRYTQRTRILVQLPARPAKADFTDHQSYRRAMQRYHRETRRLLRIERREFRRLYHQRRAPVVTHQIRG